jgi:DNA-binding transcriptional ArsR family regulator
MANHLPSGPLDVVFRALGDPTRRAVLRRLARGDAAVSELGAPFSMALPSFLQHLRVLEDAGLVRSRKAGRVRSYALCPRALAPATSWLDAQRAIWEQRLDRLDTYLLTMPEASAAPPPASAVSVPPVTRRRAHRPRTRSHRR